MTKKSWFPWVTAGFIGLIVGIGAGSDTGTEATTETETITVAAEAAGEPAEEGLSKEEAEEVMAELSPEVETDWACDYLLDFQGDVAGDFVGSIEATNVGAIPATVRAVASWDRLGSTPVEQEKEFTVKPGETRDVQFKVQAMRPDIDGHQSADGACEVRREIMPVE